ncbi:MAG: hypothetical protein B9S34_03015 [Opitutia bacterium Tous-C1TDCM]|nr:MAG: hypothetical protein B9S34_03015 [Opitutae bacterium Tous-C1TDCM]
MRLLFVHHKGNEAAIISEYVIAEREGKVLRNSDTNAMSPEDYAKRLLQDGIRKRWLWEG